MTWQPGKPAGTDKIRLSDELIRDNWAALATAINAEHSFTGGAPTGIHGTLSAATLINPKIVTKILDTNSNELFVLTAIASAINELTVANAAIGNDPTITASGGDTNIGLNLIPKGTGLIQVSGSGIVTLAATQTLTNKTLTSPVMTTPTLGDAAATSLTLTGTTQTDTNTLTKGNIVKAWANVNTDTTTTLVDSYNVSSITDEGPGDTTVTWDTDFANTTYAIAGMGRVTGASGLLTMKEGTDLSVGSIRLNLLNFSPSAADGDFTVMAIGDQ